MHLERFTSGKIAHLMAWMAALMPTPLRALQLERDELRAPSALTGVLEPQAAVLDFAQDAWREITVDLDSGLEPKQISNWASLWNDITASLLVSDTTALYALNDLRCDILRRGASDSRIPPKVVHVALYSSAEYGAHVYSTVSSNQTGTTERAKLSRTLYPFLGKVIVDIESDSKPIRKLVTSAEANALSREGPSQVNVYDPSELSRLAAVGIGRLADENILRMAALEYDKAPQPGALFDIFFELSEEQQLPELVVTHARAAVFGELAMHQIDTPIECLDEVTERDGQLQIPLLPNPFLKSSQERDFISRNVLMLAKHSDPYVLSAAAQWFAYKAATGQPWSDADYTVLEALARTAQSNELASTMLGRVSATFPTAVLNEAFLVACTGKSTTPATLAGQQMKIVFEQNPDRSSHWLELLADRKATVLLPEPSSESDYLLRRKLALEGREQALLSMALLESRGSYLNHFREALENPFAEKGEISLGVKAVALARDRESFEKLVSIGADTNVSTELRSLALWGAVLIDSPDLIDPQLRQQSEHESPFAVSAYQSEAIRNASCNPWLAKVTRRYEEWLKQRGGQGTVPQAPTAGDDVEMLFAMLQREFGTSDGLGITLSRDESARRTFLTPMLTYLQSGVTRSLQLDVALPMVELIGRMGDESARATLMDIAQRPERYLQSDRALGLFGALTDGAQGALLKMFAIRALGGCADLHDSADSSTQALLRLAYRESSSPLRSAAFLGLERLADRYDDALRESTSESERSVLTTNRSHHVAALLEAMRYNAKGIEQSSQLRLGEMITEFRLARLIDKLGGSRELVTLAVQASQGTVADTVEMASAFPQAMPSLVRSVMHALIANDRKRGDIEALDLPDEQRQTAIALYDYVASQQYFLGDPASRHFTGKGVHVAVLDAGYVLPNPVDPSMREKIVYPHGVRASDIIATESPHPTAVASTIHRAAPDATIHSYDVFSEPNDDALRPNFTENRIMRALEDITELQIAGEGDIDAINYSFGWMNVALHSEEFREDTLDLIGAYMELLSRMGVKHSIAAGNEHGENAALARFGSLGELNSVGLRLNGREEFKKNDGIFYAGAEDAFGEGRLAEFSSTQEPLRADEAFRFVSFQGVHVLLPWQDNGRWAVVPLNGTSFAAPNQTALMAWGEEALRRAGRGPLSDSAWQDLISQCLAPIPFREPFEGGYYFSVAKFLEQLEALGVPQFVLQGSH